MAWFTRENFKWFPHGITLGRVGLTFLGYGAAQARDTWLLTGIIVAAVVTDFLDGPVARYMDASGPFGQALDTAADAIFYGSLLAWVYLWSPEIALFTELWWVVPVMGALLIGSLLFGKLRRGLLGFHNRYTKASCTAAVLSTLYVIHLGFTMLLVYGILAVLGVDVAHRFIVSMRADEGDEADEGGAADA